MDMSFYLYASILIVLLAGIWYWLFKPKKRNLEVNIDRDNFDQLEEDVAYYRSLEEDDKKKFRERVKKFLSQVKITGVETSITERDKMLVAAGGVIPTFGFPVWNHYPRLHEVIIYEGAFRWGDFATEGENRDVAGMVGDGYMNGKMILSKKALHNGFFQPGRNNTVIHEFAHLIDKSDGATTGVPSYFMENQYLIPWAEMIRKEIQRIESGNSDIDTYALTNQAEFFAVISEYFFNWPIKFAEHHPKLHAMMERIYDQDMDNDGEVGTVDGEDPIELES